MTSGISADGLVKVYEALGVKPEGKVAVKISTGEPGGHNFLQPALIERINSRHGTHIVDYAEQIDLGSKEYELVNID